jgi:macrodomain Ter protein organizer (MatP/YcbG family)
VLKELDEELQGILSGRLKPLLDEDRRATRRGYRTVSVPVKVYKKLEKLANNQHKDISDVIGTLVKGLK